MRDLPAQIQDQPLSRSVSTSLPGQLSGAFTHELAQPLTAILANAEAGLHIARRRPAVPTEIREILDDIVKDTLHAVEMIGRLRSLFARSGDDRQVIELNQIVRDVLKSTQGDLDARGVSVTTELTSQGTLACIDALQLTQVLLNLIANACDAMWDRPRAERQLTIATQVDEDGRAIECSVTDRGHGITADSMARIFEPFVTTKDRGLGLGLSICRSIIIAHGGRLWAENASPRGATFRFSLSLITAA
jgi:two-component system sensor kinase FixL